MEIGKQNWMAQNLNYNYNQGSAKSICYDGEESNCAKFGRLYSWSAAVDSAALFDDAGKGCGKGKTCGVSESVRGVCPSGWHLPNSTEWKTLTETLGDTSITYVAKVLATKSGWKSAAGTNEYGFSAYPTGCANSDGLSYGKGERVDFWFADEMNEDDAKQVSIYVEGNFFTVSKDAIDALVHNTKKNNMFYVRCVKD